MTDFASAFALLKAVLAKHADYLAVAIDAPGEYALAAKTPSPFKQHKGQPLRFGSVRMGKSYVSFHLMPLYMSPALLKNIPPGVKKRMQGKTCFNFKADPDAKTLLELASLTEASVADWRKRQWL